MKSQSIKRKLKLAQTIFYQLAYRNVFLPLILFTVFWVSNLNSQNASCGTNSIPSSNNNYSSSSSNCSGSSSAFNNKYNKLSFYKPTIDDPLITLKVVFHIFNTPTKGIQSSGYSKLQLDTLMSFFVDGYDRYSKERTAHYMQNFTPPFTQNVPGHPDLMDSRLRFEIVGAYFYTEYNDSVLYRTTNTDTLFYTVNSVDPSRLEKGLPVFFNGANFGTYTGYATDNGTSSFVHTSFGWGPYFPWACFAHLRHELGHNMDLWHVYHTELANNGCTTDEFLSDVFPYTNTICPTSAIPNSHPCGTCDEGDTLFSNNIMTPGLYHSKDLGNEWISPLQMARRLRSMHLFKQTRRFVKERTSEHKHYWSVNGDETWDFDIQMYRDIVVKSGNILTIKCRVAMATDGKIIVEKGAKLIIDGGEITGWCKKTPSGSLTQYSLWKGIEIDGDPTQAQNINSSTGLCLSQGIVHIKNNGIISYAQKGIITSVTDSLGVWKNNTSGGIVIAENSSFINNIYDIIFYKYPTISSVCEVKNCNFKTNGLIGSYSSANTQIVPREHIKLFQNRGLAIKSCTFEAIPGTYNPANHGVGIYSTDSDFNVFQVGSDKNYFKNLQTGIWVDNFNPINSANIRNCIFTNNCKGIVSENCNYFWAEKDSIYISQGYTGIYMFNSQTYKIKNNYLKGTTRNGEIGVITYGSNNGAHEIYRNSFSTLGAGIIAMDNNGGIGTGALGLKMNCNDFNPSTYNNTDIAMTKFVIMPSVDPNQSPASNLSSNNLVRNIYGALYINNNSKNKWYVDPTNNQTINHGSNQNASTQPNNPHPQSSSQINVMTTGISLDYTNHCPVNASSGGAGENKYDQLLALNEYIETLQESNEDGKNDFEIQSSVVSKIGILLNDSSSGSLDSAIAIIANNQGGFDNADIQLVFAKIKSQDYSSATSLANNLGTNRIDWKNLLLKIIDIEEDSLGYERVANNTSDINFLSSYADSLGRDGQATAMAILKYALGTQHEFPLVLPEYPSSRPLSSHENLNSIVPNDEIKIFPNPAQNGVYITYENTKSDNSIFIEVRDLLGRIIFTKFSEHCSENFISVGNINNGVYFISAYNEKSELLIRTKLIIQK